MTIDFRRVTASGLTKTFGPTRALSGVELTLSCGEVTVIEGANGSGKSTLLSILALLVKPTRGTLRFEGSEASELELRARIGVLAHAAMVYPDLSGEENLTLTAALYRVPGAANKIAAMRERFEIGAFGDRPARTYSRGQMQRLALARALLHEPRLLLLDEPSTGLDAPSVARLVDAVRAEKARGAIVAVVTHDRELASAIGDRRAVLSRGRLEPGAKSA